MHWTDPADVPGLADRLRAAQREWERQGCRRAPRRWPAAVWLGEHRDEIEQLLIKETGKSAVDAAQEVPLLIMILSSTSRRWRNPCAEHRPASLPFLAVKRITVHLPAAAGRRDHRAVELSGRPTR